MNFKKILVFLFNAIEIYIPVIAFALMFIIFILQIFYRYVLNMPLMWPYEATLILFIWAAMLGATYTRRKHQHVSFTVVYDKLSPKLQMIIRSIGNFLLSFSFLISLVPVYQYIKYLNYKKSTVLRIPFNIIYFPFVVMLILIICHSIYDLIIDLKNFTNNNSLKKKSQYKG